VSRGADGSVDVLTGDGVLRLGRVQVPGRGAQPPAEVIGSVRATLGRPLVARMPLTTWEVQQ
jgi:hypothetical protein